MNTELESTLVSKINETYRASLELAETAKENASAAIEKAVECGQYLIEAKTAVGHGKWTDWYSSHVTDFNQDTASRYMRLAAFVNGGGSLEEAASQRQAFQLAGILIEPTREHGSQQSHGDACRWLTYLLKGTEQINKLKESAPVDQWPETTRTTMKEKLRPYVELFEML